jgi:hypothetical protein
MTLSHASPEGEQSHVTTVPKHLADKLVEALDPFARVASHTMNEPDGASVIVNVDRLRDASQALTEYRKATQ